MASEFFREESLTEPSPGLFESLEKKLNSTQREQLRRWLNSEREAAAFSEWEKQKARVQATDDLVASCKQMADRLQRAIDSFCGSHVGDEKIIETARAAIAKAGGA